MGEHQQLYKHGYFLGKYKRGVREYWMHSTIRGECSLRDFFEINKLLNFLLNEGYRLGKRPTNVKIAHLFRSRC